MGSLVRQLVLSMAAVTAPAVAQDVSIRSLRVGDRDIAGVLPVQLDAGRNAAKCAFSLALPAPQTFTITVESPVFDCRVSAIDTRTKTELSDGDSGAHTNAWLVCESSDATTWRIEVSSENEQGGEFTLSVLPQRVDPPKKPAEWTAATIAYCELSAKRAEEKGEFERAAHLLGVATQYAYSIADLAKMKELAQAHANLATLHQLPYELAQANAHLGAAALASNQFDRARELLDSARIVADARLAAGDGTASDKDRVAFASFVYVHLADLESATVGPMSALPYYRKFAELASRSGKAGIEALAWQKLSTTLDQTGDTKGASEALEKALATANASGNPEIVAGARLSRAQFLQNHGESDESRAECQRALQGTLSAPLRQDFLNVQTQACIDLARYEEALAAMDEIDALCKQAQFEGAAIANRINRARIALLVRDLALARTLLESLLALPETSVSRGDRMLVLSNLAAADALDDRPDDAETYFRQAIAACEAAGDRERQTQILLDLGGAQVRRKDYQAALSTFEKAAELAEERADETSAALASGDRAFALCETGQLARAYELASAAAAKLESLRSVSDAVDANETLARIALKRGDSKSTRLALARAEALLDRLPPQTLDSLCLAGIRTRYADMGEVAQDLVALEWRAEGAPAEDRTGLVAAGWLAAGRWKARVLLDGMHRRHATPEARAGDELMPAIGSRAALIEYVDGLDELYAYLVTADSARLVPLGPREPTEKDAARFVQSVAAVREEPARVIEQASRLYRALISPVLPSLPPEIATLIIVPTPRLALLPFDALVPPSSLTGAKEVDYANMRYLIDDYCVVLAPSSPVLAELQRRTRRLRPPRYLILSDPVYGTEEIASVQATPQAESAALHASLSQLDRLKHSREEAFEVARLLLSKDPTATPEQLKQLVASYARRTDVLSTATFDWSFGAQVSAASLARDLTAYTCMHIAAHARIDANDARRSGLVLSYEPARGGLFSLQDVLALHVDTDLVVLSACDTASGPVVRGEGVQSLAYGFLEAGSHAVVATLWRVDDREAAELMKSFHAASLDDGLHPALALRRAKLEFRHSRIARGNAVTGSTPAPTMISANPYYWASHVYIGAPAN
jgi:CHAT domain-containing protein